MGNTLLKNLRKQLGLSLNDVQNQTGISLVLLSKYELGHMRPTDEHLLKFAALYNVEVDRLIKEFGLARPKSNRVRRIINGKSRNPWTSEEESLLLTTVLEALREGNSQHQALQQAAKRIGRSADACAGYLNNFIRPFYSVEIEQAKREGKLKRTQRRVLHQVDLTSTTDGQSTMHSMLSMPVSGPLHSVSPTELVMRLLELANQVDSVRDPLEDSKVTRQLTAALKQISSIVIDIMGMRQVEDKEFISIYDGVLLAFLEGELTESQAVVEYASWPLKYQEWKQSHATKP